MLWSCPMRLAAKNFPLYIEINRNDRKVRRAQIDKVMYAKSEINSTQFLHIP